MLTLSIFGITGRASWCFPQLAGANDCGKQLTDSLGGPVYRPIVTSTQKQTPSSYGNQTLLTGDNLVCLHNYTKVLQ